MSNFAWVEYIRVWHILVVFLIILFLVAWFGYEEGQARVKHQKKCDSSELIATSLLGILGLLLGFTFSLVIDRYETRRYAVRTEASAIIGAYLNSTLMKIDQKQNQAYYKKYLDLRVEYANLFKSDPRYLENIKETREIQKQLWRQAKEITDKARDDVVANYVESLRGMYGALEHRTFVMRHNIPISIYFVLLLITMLSVGILSYDRGVRGDTFNGKQIFLIVTFSLVVGFIFDLDHPRRGLVRIDQSPITDIDKVFDRYSP